MRKLLLIALVGLSANSAFASKARLMALGQSTDLTALGIYNDGTLLFKDNRNIFLNPAQAAGMNNSFNFEMGNANTYTASPIYQGNGEGGMIYDFAAGKLGFQLGRRTDITNAMMHPTSTTPTSSLVPPKDSVDIIYAQGKDKSWGAGIHYGSVKNDPAGAGDQSATELILSGGAVLGRMEFYGNLAVIANAEDTASTEKFEGKSYLKGGMGFQIDDTSKIMGMVFLNGYDYTTTGTVKTEVRSLNLDVRYARTHKPKTDLMFFYGGGFTNSSGDATTSGTKTDITVQQLPLFLGLEGNAASWLDLRASVTQALLLNTIKRGTETQHNPNTTTIGAGATLKFTNFNIDAMLAGAGNGTIDSDSLFTNASVIYNF